MNSINPYESTGANSTVATTYDFDDLFWILFRFDGRIPRRIFWLASIGVGILYLLANWIVHLIFGSNQYSLGLNLSLLVLYIALLWINLSLNVKRWHDRDKSGWWGLIGIIPIVGPIWVIIETGFCRGTNGDNRFGPDNT